MKRDLQAMAAREHDVVIVGGGITGASVARDAARRGLSVALLEKGDFCHATSAASSKLIHGGLRYLKNFELSLVRESLRERRTWEVIAPHLVHPLRTMLPIYKRKGSPGRLALRAGLTLYDLLAFDRNQVDDDDKKMPGHESLDREATLAAEPGLSPERLTGAMVYYDCQMYSSERLCFEHVVDAVEHEAMVANYAEVTGFVFKERTVEGVEVRDRIDGRVFNVRGRVVVNASGPWADRLLAHLPGQESPPHIQRSKGIHIITRPLTKGHAIALEHKGGHFFLLPWRGLCLIGTTDTQFLGDPDQFAVTEADIASFIEVVNSGYPGANIVRDDVLHFYGGMRPLVESEGGDTYNASRRAEIYDHAKTDKVEGLISALGGKWTTSRHLAEQVLEHVGRKLGQPLRACVTATLPLPGGQTGRFADFVAQAKKDHPELAPEVVEHLTRNYGSCYAAVLAHADADASLRESIGSGRPERRAEIVHAVREEMAIHMDDVLMRRTGIGTIGAPSDEVFETVADLMAAELGWDAPRRRGEIQRARAGFVPDRVGT